MSVLIKMEMPTSCYNCPLAMQDYTTLFGNNFKQTRNSYACVLTHKAITSTKRNRFCPLVPVPPHGRLIDAEYAHDHFEACMQNGRPLHHPEIDEILGWVDDIPTIIEAEEVE